MGWTDDSAIQISEDHVTAINSDVKRPVPGLSQEAQIPRGLDDRASQVLFGKEPHANPGIVRNNGMTRCDAAEQPQENPGLFHHSIRQEMLGPGYARWIQRLSATKSLKGLSGCFIVQDFARSVIKPVL